MNNKYKKAAKLYHSLYPQSNFYNINFETQKKFLEIVERKFK